MQDEEYEEYREALETSILIVVIFITAEVIFLILFAALVNSPF